MRHEHDPYIPVSFAILDKIDIFLPMVLSQITTIIHCSPALPVLFRLVHRGSPDLLSPDDILEV